MLHSSRRAEVFCSHTGDVVKRELHKSSKVVMAFAGVTGTAAGQRKQSAQSAQDTG